VVGGGGRGKPGAEYDGIGKGALIFSSDSKRMAYAAQKGEKWLGAAQKQRVHIEKIL
jgi:hypothetical protein